MFIWLIRISYFSICFFVCLILCLTYKRILKEYKSERISLLIFIVFYFLNSFISNYILQIKGIITILINFLILILCYLVTIRLRIYGLTGQIASGKSTLSCYLREKYQATVIDIDKVNAEVLEEEQVKKEIKVIFGEVVFDEFNKLNKLEVRKIIFSDPKKKKQLEKITHFRVFKKLFWVILQSKLKDWRKIIVIENAILLKVPLLKFICYMIIAVVSNNISKKIRRIMERDGIEDRKLAEKILKTQTTIEEFTKQADLVIPNDGDLDDLYVLGDKIAEILKQ